MAILFSLAVGLVGLLMWGFCTNPKLLKIGEYLFLIGTFWFVGQSGDAIVKLLARG